MKVGEHQEDNMDKKVKIAVRFDKITFSKLSSGKSKLNIYIWSIDGTKYYCIDLDTNQFNKLLSGSNVVFNNITEFEEGKK